MDTDCQDVRSLLSSPLAESVLMMMHHLSWDIVSVRHISESHPSFTSQQYCRVLIKKIELQVATHQRQVRGCRHCKTGVNPFGDSTPSVPQPVFTLHPSVTIALQYHNIDAALSQAQHALYP